MTYKIDYENIEIVGDGRGTMQGKYLLNTDRPMTRARWLLECFPEWGTFLNRQIDATQVEPGTYAIWWTGGMGFVFKSPEGAVFMVDNYAGPSHYTEYEYCGVCRSSGARTIDWMRINPQVLDPWAFSNLDAVFCSHQHADHTDIYTLKAATQTSDCRFVGPLSAVERMRIFQVPESRIDLVRPGDVVRIKDVEIEILPNYDRIASLTGGPGVDVKPGMRRSYDDVAVTFLFKVGGVNLCHLGDTLYHNAYRAFQEKWDVDVVTFNIGHNAPGATDKMTPYDAVRLGESIGARLLLPMHWDNWGNTQADPEEVRRIAAQHTPNVKVVVPQWGIKWVYPTDQDVERLVYPDWRERYRPDLSWEYGEPARRAAEERGDIFRFG